MTRLNEAFDAVRASEALKTQTAQAVVREMRGDGARRRGRRLLPALAVAVCLLLAAGLGGHALYYTPTTVLSIDINPSLEMDINRFDRVIALNGYNDDGAALAAALDVQNLRYDAAVDALLANATIADCLARGEELAIAVVQARRSRVRCWIMSAAARTGTKTPIATPWRLAMRSWQRRTTRGFPAASTTFIRNFWPTTRA